MRNLLVDVHTEKMADVEAQVEADTDSTEPSKRSTIEVGGVFGSFCSLVEQINKFQKDNSVQFYIRDSRKIEATKRRAPHRKFNENLVYSEIVYCCIHGGKNFKCRSKGEQPNQ